MKSKLLAISLCAILVGCQQAPTKTIQVDPEWPSSVGALSASWKVVNINGEPWVGMPFEDFQIKFRPWMNDITRYIADQKSMICYYRAPLKEPKCED